ncbi:MAG: TetR/AcrR family transcriptional regulator [Kiritimatiellae bacterium]|nr:TetR/AcrR family transcriptional regulator [Kiritimatiellia bacterium]
MTGRASMRDKILDAAEQIVLEQGASHMTMDAVATRAGVSKGGLIYHFPSQQHLMRALLERFIQRVEKWRQAVLDKLPNVPLRNLKGYLLSWLTLGAAARRSASALLASATREPDMIELVRRRRRRVWSEFLADVANREMAMILALAVEGMWMSELLGISLLSEAERKRLGRNLLKLADEMCQKPRQQQQKKTGKSGT